MVKIDGVGAVYEYPKKFLCLVDFQMWSAVCSIPSGQGSVVTCGTLVLQASSWSDTTSQI
jgi:hypothetical protein